MQRKAPDSKTQQGRSSGSRLSEPQRVQTETRTRSNPDPSVLLNAPRLGEPRSVPGRAIPTPNTNVFCRRACAPSDVAGPKFLQIGAVSEDYFAAGENLPLQRE